ncbi:carbohydrate-binding family 9-like protein [Paenibacillus soyae]|uniref:Carbohydrate-binding family 9-like protein n=1 Tax=Paenibacillus soyae TaxID=2969249 RepID=A0A9X2S9M6_9BACL|nr:carbohydrate-binding family 9-like protein [Paenibacillus soyae]MCR2805250.1 carbohydrate-binding family 9-like protein [Paenibacillus soyae]
MTYRIAIAGCGGIANQHLDAIKQINRTKGRAAAVAIADLNEERMRAASERYGSELRQYADYKRMIADVRPDIVIITLPHHLHMEAACFAAEAGCHILLEKPMALRAEECDRIIEGVRQSGVSLLVGHTQRYIAENLAAKRIIDEGSLGRLVMLHDVRHTDYYAEGRPEWFFRKALSGGGIAFNLGSHSVDKAIWLTGSAVSSVQAGMTCHGNRGDVEGSVMARLQLRGGVTATIVQSGYKGASANYTELLFTNGSLRLETGRALYRSDGGAYSLVETHAGSDPFVLQLDELIASIETGQPASCSMEDARHVVEVLEGMYRSHRSGREELVGEARSRHTETPAAVIPPARLSREGAWSDFSDGAQLAIGHYMWLPDWHGPKARIALSCTTDELQIQFRAYEPEPLVRFANLNDPVYKDSCVEWFLQPDPLQDARYLNFELNAAGTILVGLGTGRLDRVYLEADELPPLHIRAERQLQDPATGETYWSVRFRLPLSWLAGLFPGFQPGPGARMRGNFYKCGDETALPHFGSWSRVGADEPDFHRSQDFGWLILG